MAKAARQVQILKNKAILADQLDVAESFLNRLIGLLDRSQMRDGEGLWFPRCHSIHMWFMRVTIDVVFLQKRERIDATATQIYAVTSVHRSVRPWRPLPLSDNRATDTLELSEGTLMRHQLEIGDLVCIA